MDLIAEIGKSESLLTNSPVNSFKSFKGTLILYSVHVFCNKTFIHTDNGDNGQLRFHIVNIVTNYIIFIY